MLGMFSIGLKSLLFLAIASLCIVAAFISQLDDDNKLRQKSHIPHIPVLRSQGGRNGQLQEPLDDHVHTTSHTPNSPSSVLHDVLPQTHKFDSMPSSIHDERKAHHPIDDLIDKAQDLYENVLKKQTTGVNEAAAAYRRRRGRQPPPNFDQWVKFAEEHNAVMVEEFFDRIYQDLDPFWAIPPEGIRDAARSWPHFISIRDGNATQRTDNNRPWMNLWLDMISQISAHLPDLDIAINEMDESRVMVPWESINQYLELASMRYSKFPANPESQVTDYPSRFNKTYAPEIYPDHGFHTLGSLWSLAQEACPPDSPGRNAQWDEVNYQLRVQFPSGYPDGSYQGYVSNWTHAKDACTHAHLREMHGSFVEPISMSSSTKLVPLFGGSKLPMNNDILMPAAMYWTDDKLYKGGEKRISWEEKETKAIWRGDATGGRNTYKNWRRFQRHRFVGMMNGTQVHAQELLNAQLDHPDMKFEVGDADSKTPHHFPLPRQNLYELSSQLDGRLGPWVDTFADGKFVRLLCFPAEPENGPNCSYTSPYFEHGGHMPMEEQYRFKYLPDIDGNSFSGRYRGFLRSFSLPIKATLYNEWHDSRLFPWKHFVPMDNTFVDFYGIMEYFLGYEPVGEGTGTTVASTPEGGHFVAGTNGVDEVLRKVHALEQPPPDAMAAPPVHEALQRFDAEGDRKVKRQSPTSQTPRKYPHDAAAKAIAEAGHEWAERVLRKEDMLIYTYRLLLEYGRLASDSRQRMGWVGDGIVFGVNDESDYPESAVEADAKKAAAAAGVADVDGGDDDRSGVGAMGGRPGRR